MQVQLLSGLPMYNPKDVLTANGYEDYRAHLRNMENAIFFIENHRDDLHIGALDSKQEEDWLNIVGTFEKLLPLLKNGDGEKD
jgi:hypothetical protein